MDLLQHCILLLYHLHEMQHPEISLCLTKVFLSFLLPKALFTFSSWHFLTQLSLFMLIKCLHYSSLLSYTTLYICFFIYITFLSAHLDSIMLISTTQHLYACSLYFILSFKIPMHSNPE